MFRKTKLKVEEKKKSDALTIISENTFVTGDMSSEGNMKAARLVIGAHGRVSGSLAAEVVEVYGVVVGDISARFVRLGSSARVNGNITQENITIETGAVLEGRCHRADDPIPAEQGPEDLMITDARTKKEK